MAPTVETMSFPAMSSHSSGDDHDDHTQRRANNASGQRSLSMGHKTASNPSSIRNLKENETKYRTEFFKKEPCLYTHEVFKHAAVIFAALKHEKTSENPYIRRKQEEEVKTRTPEIPHIDFENARDKKMAFELAFQTLKFQSLLEEMLEDVSFYSQYSEHRDDEGTVMVILQDFQTRKFQTRHLGRSKATDADIRIIEEAILSCAVKLNASLARNRIRHQVASIDHLLPLAVRDSEASSNVPVYLWVNNNKTSLAAVLDRLTMEGFIQVAPTFQLSGHMFCVDPHCDDVITFSPEVREDIMAHDLVNEGLLVLQDKSSCYGPHSVRFLLNEGDDVIHVNIGSGATTAHLSSLLGKKTNHIWAFSNSKSDEETMLVKKTFEKLRVKNVKVMADQFLDTSPEDPRLKNAKVVLISAECSKSGIGNPVDFVVSEGEDMTILKDLSIGETDNSKLAKLIANEGAVLKHAMRMSKVQAIIYCTRSVNESENETAILRAMEYANTALLRKVPYRVAPPVLSFSAEDIDNGNILDGKFIKVKPTGSSNGCFVALVTREPEEIQETAKDILERAAAKGLLGPKVNKVRKQREPGEDSDRATQNNGPTAGLKNDIDVREKLLHRRVRKPQQKISSPARVINPPLTLNVTAKVQTRNLGYKGSGGSMGQGRLTQTRHTSTRTSESVVSRLYKPRIIKSISPLPKPKSFIQEYRKVVKHPAPFR